MQTMKLPDFYEAAPRIAFKDPLAALLGAAENGVIEYSYADAVKLAGHSCPTVASAYLMTRAALGSLYPSSLPERGAVHVELRDARDSGTTGVVANVACMLTGAAGDAGFKGIEGRFDRRRLLSFGSEIPGQIRFTRTDSGAGVTVSARLDRVPTDSRTFPLLAKCLRGLATPEDAELFRTLWQARVRALLVERADDPEVFRVH